MLYYTLQYRISRRLANAMVNGSLLIIIVQRSPVRYTRSLAQCKQLRLWASPGDATDAIILYYIILLRIIMYNTIIYSVDATTGAAIPAR